MYTLVTVFALLLPLGAAAAPPAKAPATTPPSAAAEAPRAKTPRAMGTLWVTSPVVGAEIKVDDQVVGRTPMPGPWTLAPGVHRVQISAEGKSPFSARVRIVPGRTTTVPAYVAPAPTAKPTKTIHRVRHVGPGFSLSTAGYVTAGVGLAAAGAGVALGLMADGYAADARELDRADPANTRADLESLIADADQAAFWANVGYGVGAVATLTGVAMVLLASDGPLGLSVAPTPGGALIGGHF